MIRIDALWLCTQPQDMRAGADRLLAVVVNTVGQAQAGRRQLPCPPGDNYPGRWRRGNLLMV
ncbi:hypothetical protein [Variovorax rhizosphaerae]|uniref:Transposase n=1 Tax=Variovorax rhizosphaerae TaxID=1836200 RepID=A0ABU8WYA2_9BURK